MSFLKLVLFLTAITTISTVQAGWGNTNNADAAWNSKSDTTSAGYTTFQELQSKLQNEMDELKGMIDREEKERQLGDEEIVNALERYTQQLQSSLSVISS